MRLPDIASSAEPIKISMQIIASYAHHLPAAPYSRDLLSARRVVEKSRARDARILNEDTKIDFTLGEHF